MPKKTEAPPSDDLRAGGKSRAAKAAAAAEKDAAAARAREEAESAAWADGADVKRAAREAAAATAAAEKALRKKQADEQAAREAEEASRERLRGAEKVAARKAHKVDEHSHALELFEAEPVSASGIDGAIAALTIASAPEGAAGADDDRHPERRMKAAYAAYQERELPRLKTEFPSLRRTQLNEMMWRNWQRSEENPMRAAAAAGKK